MRRVRRGAENAVVWKLHADNTMEPIKISLGHNGPRITQVAAVIKGELKEGGNAPHHPGSAMPKRSRRQAH